MSKKSVTYVAAGVLYDKINGKILITSRPKGKSFSGYWEFPGGKVERDETYPQALQRELQEELGIDVDTDHIVDLGMIEQQYTSNKIHMQVFIVKQWDKEPMPVEKQILFWQRVDKEIIVVPLLPTTTVVFDKVRQFLEIKE